MNSDVEHHASERSVATFNDGNVAHRRSERRRQHRVVAALSQHICLERGSQLVNILRESLSFH